MPNISNFVNGYLNNNNNSGALDELNNNNNNPIDTDQSIPFYSIIQRN